VSLQKKMNAAIVALVRRGRSPNDFEYASHKRRPTLPASVLVVLVALMPNVPVPLTTLLPTTAAAAATVLADAETPATDGAVTALAAAAAAAAALEFGDAEYVVVRIVVVFARPFLVLSIDAKGGAPRPAVILVASIDVAVLLLRIIVCPLLLNDPTTTRSVDVVAFQSSFFLVA